jgi:3-oxoadipate enol-lactonase
LPIEKAVDGLADEFGDVHSRETVQLVMDDSLRGLIRGANVEDFVPALAHRFARERLKALARAHTGRRARRPTPSAYASRLMGEAGFVDVEGGRIYYEAEGDGRPVLLIHGGLGTLRMWDEQVPRLAERSRVIRYDTRGFGRTESADVEFSNRDDAIAVLDHLGVMSAAVVGQSRGAMIALDLALDRPERVDALVSVAGGIGGYQPELEDGMSPPPWDELERLWEQKEWPALAELETQVWVDGWGQSRERVDPEVRRRVHDWILAGHEAGKAEGRPVPMTPPAVERLDELRVPTLVLVGAADEPGAVAAGRKLGSTPNAQLVEFENVAHMIQLEQPDRFAEVVLEFIAGARPRQG